MSDAFFIGDGYDLKGRIAAIPGLYPELRFTYRPALFEERNAFVVQSGDKDKRTKATTDLVLKHVSEWNATPSGKPAGSDVPRLKPLLLDRLVDVIVGYAAAGEEATDLKNS